MKILLFITFGYNFDTHFSLYLAKEKNIKSIILAPYASFEHTLKQETGYGIPHQCAFASGLDNISLISSMDEEVLIAHDKGDPDLLFADAEHLHSMRKSYKDDDHFIKQDENTHSMTSGQLNNIKAKVSSLNWVN